MSSRVKTSKYLDCMIQIQVAWFKSSEVTFSWFFTFVIHHLGNAALTKQREPGIGIALERSSILVDFQIDGLVPSKRN